MGSKSWDMAEKIGGGRVLQMGLFHYNSLKVCLLSLQYNPVGVGTFFFLSPRLLHVCITSVINGSAHRRHSGTKAWKKMRPVSSFTCLSVRRLLWRLTGAITDAIVKRFDMLNTIMRHAPHEAVRQPRVLPVSAVVGNV